MIRTLVLLLVLSGCGVTLTRKAPPAEPPPATWPRCTEHYFWQIVDGAVAVMGASGAIYFAQSSDDYKALGIMVEGGIALGFGISALASLARPAECRAARAAYENAAAQGR